jgi:anti-sigma B factor antagonist
VAVSSHMPNPSPPVVRLAGVLDETAAARARELLDEALAQWPAVLIVDLADVRFLDAAGVNVLAGAARTAAAQRTSLRVLAPRASVRRVLDLTGLTERVRVVAAAG